MSEQLEFWKNCSSCKKTIGFKQKYYECSVSTCQGKRTGYAFCSVFCWERHLPGAKHRDAGAIEKLSPSLTEWKNELSAIAVNSEPAGGSSQTVASSMPQRRIVGQPTSSSSVPKSAIHTEVLVVVSKMKTYIKEIADMNTSGEVADILSDLIREACDEAINQAKADGRKTVMGRDFK
jgi:hypothetical protein